MAATTVAGLATVTPDGDPWASLVTYVMLGDGAPVLCLSRLAELDASSPPTRGRVFSSRRRRPADPRRGGRVTPRAVPSARRTGRRSRRRARRISPRWQRARSDVDFADSLWILHVHRVVVGGYAAWTPHRVDYVVAVADPVATALRPASPTATRTTGTRCS